jgi:AcrR family transcriptional regulator
VNAKTLSRVEWLENALNAASRTGGAKLRIDSLAKEVGVTKGSFYWHFKNRDDFVRSLIDYWHERYTLKVSDYLDVYEGSAKEKLHKLMEMVFVEQLTRHDLAIRSWAIAEP